MTGHARARSPFNRLFAALVAALLVLGATQREARADDKNVALLVGIGLLAGGLVVGAPGVAILAVCDEGSDCYSTETTVAGWVLLAPGIPGILVGGILIAASAGSSSRGRLQNPLDELPVRVAISPAPPPPTLPLTAGPRVDPAPSGGVLRLSFSF